MIQKRFRSMARRLALGAGLSLTVLLTARTGTPAHAAGPPTLEPLKLQVFGTSVSVSVRASEPVAIGYQVAPAGAATAAVLTTPSLETSTAQAQAPLSQSPASSSRIQPQPAPTPKPGMKPTPAPSATPTPAPSLPPKHTNVMRDYETAFDFGVPNLKSNTAYTFSLSATTPDGRTATAQQSFTTLKLRVRVSLREIDVDDDGDTFGSGEPMWTVNLDYADGPAVTCWPNTAAAGEAGICQAGSYSEGRFYPRNYRGEFLGWTFAEENFDTMPAEFSLFASAVEEDFIPVLPTIGQFISECLLHFPCGFHSRAAEKWQAPLDKEWSSTTVTVEANDTTDDFKSRLIFTFETFHDNLSYPAPRNTPTSAWLMP